MSFPTLSFEISYLTEFFQSQNKLLWIKNVLGPVESRQLSNLEILNGAEQKLASIEISIYVLIVITLFNIWIIYANYSKEKIKIILGRIIFMPITITLAYYFSKLILSWFLWLLTLGWLFIPVLLISSIGFGALVIFLSKFVLKDKKNSSN